MIPRPLFYAVVFGFVSVFIMAVDKFSWGFIPLTVSTLYCGYWIGVHETMKELFHPKSES